jgi:uncharacterized membrane protein YgcG
VFQRWRIGDEDLDDGLLILLFTRQRQQHATVEQAEEAAAVAGDVALEPHIEIVTGEGLGRALHGSFVRRCRDVTMAPHFGKSRYGAGLQQGVDEISERIRIALETGGRDALDARKGLNSSASSRNWHGQHTLIAVVIIFGAAVAAYEADRQKRACSKCGADGMQLKSSLMWSAAEAEAILPTPCDRVCFAIGSVSFELLQCPLCRYEEVYRFPQAGFNECGHCGCHAEHEASPELMVEPALNAGGLVRVTKTCSHCRAETISQRVSSSSVGSTGLTQTDGRLDKS